ncbi:hypothetical protein HZH66_010186 [Vespula vulgaris]|uniref:Uncharacterized protein n=1 Tax=Vespula vulgaris TaxID=7454 RepID=A0A834JIU1_VESVU|nr:hypothetical protein HZH66_010186 [Vespula vulgaris]
MSMRNFPPSFWNSQHPSDVYEYPTDPWHAHYAPYQHRAVHEYHQHNMAAAASYSGLLLGSARGHHTSHHAAHHAAHHVHAAASYKDWTSATPSQSLVDVSSAPPYPHGPYASLSVNNDLSILLTFEGCGQISVTLSNTIQCLTCKIYFAQIHLIETNITIKVKQRRPHNYTVEANSAEILGASSVTFVSQFP